MNPRSRARKSAPSKILTKAQHLAGYTADELQLHLLDRAMADTCQAIARANATLESLLAKRERQKRESNLLKLRIIHALVLPKTKEAACLSKSDTDRILQTKNHPSPTSH